MKLSLPRKSLLTAMRLMTQLKPVREVDNYALLSVSSDGCTVRATDLAVTIEIALGDDVQVSQSGATLLPIQRTFKLLQYSDEDALTIEAEGDSAVQIAMPNGNVILRSFNVADFPLRPETPQAAGYLPCVRLAEAFEKTVFAVDRNSVQYTLCGVCLQFSESKLAAIATDRRRAAMVQRNINWYGEPLKGSVIVPEKAVNIITRILSDREGNIEIGLRDNTIHFAQDNVEVWTLLVEGRFPKCDQLFEPVDGEVTIRIPREPFVAAVKKATCISEDIMQVSLVIRDNVIEVSSATSCGSVDLEVDVSGNGNDAIILFDPAFLIEYLSKSHADEVLMSFHGATEPVRFTDGDSKCVIMPMVPASEG